MDKKIDRELLVRYVKDECSAQEIEAVRQFLFQPAWQEALEELLAEDFDAFIADQPTADESTVWNERFQRKLSQQSVRSILPRRSKIWKYAAAVVLIGLSSLLVVLHRMQDVPQRITEVESNEEVLPGSDKALLTLADGTTIALSEAANGNLTEQDGLQIEKTADDEVVYSVTDAATSTLSRYNSISTPTGGQYRVTLPDGSKAWLNAGSSLTYPVHFKKTARSVKMTGEVYFEIAKLKQAHSSENVPFFVETAKQHIQVLGTKFNVNAYTDEPYIRTALVEGSVKITALADGKTVLLKPGQEALLSDNLQVRSADLDQQLGWKRGDFVFKGENLAAVLRQISRWYGVEVECPPHLQKLRFAGIISRAKPIASVIKVMESTNDIHITLKERRLVVTD